MPETRSLHRKLAQVMWEADRIPKNGKAPAAMGGYPFVQVGDAADVIRKALAEQKVSMIPTGIELLDQREVRTANDKIMDQVTVRTTWTLTDGDSGESIVIQSMGAGVDVGDKAIPKAQTNAMKYALLMGFLLSTGDDPEAGTLPERGERNLRVGAADHEAAPPSTNGGLIGVARKQTPKTTDFEMRQSPDGPFLGFRLHDGKGAGVICEARGPLAEALMLVRDEVIDKRVQVWGSWIDYAPPVVQHAYRAYRIDRIQTPDYTLPAPSTDEAEIESLPLFAEGAAA